MQGELLETYIDRHAAEAADAFATLDDAGARQVLDALAPPSIARLLDGGSIAGAQRVFSLLEPARAASAVALLGHDLGALLLRNLDGGATAQILAALPTELGQRLQRLLRYPDDTAGALMDAMVPAFTREMTVATALERVRRDPKNALYYVYVVDGQRRLCGVVTLRELMLADATQPLQAIMNPRPEALAVTTPLETVITHPGWRRAHALPVVEDGVFVGAVRYRTLRAAEQRQETRLAAGEAGRTARELAEVYALGAGSLFSWIGSWFSGSVAPSAGKATGGTGTDKP